MSNSDQQRTNLPRWKLSPLAEFIAIELSVFIAQIFVIYLVVYLISNRLTSESALTEFAKGRLNAYSVDELLWTLFAITSVMGIICISKEIISVKIIEKIAGEVILELPRTIYIFGSGVTAVTYAISVYFSNRPATGENPEMYKWSAYLFAFIFFVYGCFIKWLLVRKRLRAS